MTEVEMKCRTKEFALALIELSTALPSIPAGQVIARQMIRAATSVGANYRAACRGRSKAEFVSKLGIAEEEADESSYWLELILAARLLPPQRILPMLSEADEITRILVSSRKTATRNRSN